MSICLVWLAAALSPTGTAGGKDPQAGSGNVVLKRFPVKVSQGVAVDEKHFYAISNTTISKHDKATGAVKVTWRADTKNEAFRHFTHMNSAVALEGKLYCAHSRYPADPNDNSLEIFDIRQDRLEHEKTIRLPRRHGSLTWADRHEDGSWWVCYAVYGKENNRNTTLVQCRWENEGFAEVRTWKFPAEVVAQWGSMSCSGGSWGPDGYLYTTGHDDAKVHVLTIDPAGDLKYVRTEEGVGFHGQAIAWDRFSDPPVLWGIVRGREISQTSMSCRQQPPNES
ncbi:MAG: hypothetical protein FJ280_17575 [Planctomycetes bacterium]|nr:hypothetical protein [Planctomycetota bacterium]